MDKKYYLVKIEELIRKIFTEKYYSNISSLIKGHGLEFEDFRRYELGDDAKYINWKLSAKYDKLFINLYQTEKYNLIHIYFDLNFNWKTGNKDNFINIINNILFSIIVLGKKYQATIMNYIWDIDEKLNIIDLKKALYNPYKLLNKLKSVLSLFSKKYISHLSDIYQQEKKYSKKHIIIIFSDFLSLNDNLKQNFINLSTHHKIVFLKLNIPNLIGYNYNSWTSKLSNYNENLSPIQLFKIN